MRRFTVIVIAISFIACTTARDQRRGAHELALSAAKLQRHLTDFATTRTDVDVARQSIANDLQARALSIGAFNQTVIKSWEAADDKSRIKLFTTIVEGADAVASQQKAMDEALVRNEQLVRDTKSKVALREDELGALQKTLGTLARNDKLRASFDFYEAFFGEVQKSVDEAKKAGTEAAAAAAQSPAIKKGSEQ